MTFAETITLARAENRTLLSEVEAKAALAEAGVSVTATSLAQTREAAAAQAEAIGYPVALKVVSPNVAHKSDVGGVILGLESHEEVAEAYDEIISLGAGGPARGDHRGRLRAADGGAGRRGHRGDDDGPAVRAGDDVRARRESWWRCWGMCPSASLPSGRATRGT